MQPSPSRASHRHVRPRSRSRVRHELLPLQSFRADPPSVVSVYGSRSSGPSSPTPLSPAGARITDPQSPGPTVTDSGLDSRRSSFSPVSHLVPLPQYQPLLPPSLSDYCPLDHPPPYSCFPASPHRTMSTHKLMSELDLLSDFGSDDLFVLLDGGPRGSIWLR